MLKFIARRLLLLAPILFGLSLITFAFVRSLLPGLPAQELLGDRDRRDRAVTVEDPSADGSVWVQYARYVGHVARGELGYSETSGREVGEELTDRLPASAELALVASTLALVLGVWIGSLAARREGGLMDRGSVFLSLVGISFPFFVLALFLRYAIGIELGWLPGAGRLEVAAQVDHPTNLYILDAIVTLDPSTLLNALKHIVLPAIALGAIPLAVIMRSTRSATVRVLDEGYVRTAEAKGLDQGVVDRRHILRNAILPVIGAMGPQIGLLMAGLVLTEPVFSWDGLGSWMFEAIAQRDYAVVHAGLLTAAVIVVIGKLALEVLNAFLDPRIRYP